MAAMAEVTQGMKVRSSDGANLGKIIRAEPGYFVVEKGFFFPKDYTVQRSLVQDVREGECWLAVSRADLEREGGGAEGEAISSSERRMEQDAGGYAEASRAGTASEREGEHRMQLSEEELEARKRVRDAGEVTIRKDVVTERRQIDVPVTKEEVHVERVPASGASAPGGEAFDEKTIRVPIREEEVEITKRPRVREELQVSKTARQEERRVEGEVRREEARVDRTDSGEEPARGYRRPEDEDDR
jgi:uncharacterized protein (TIGR02271 family)